MADAAKVLKMSCCKQDILELHVKIWSRFFYFIIHVSKLRGSGKKKLKELFQSLNAISQEALQV